MYFYIGNRQEKIKMKTFEELFADLKAKAAAGDPASGTVKELEKGSGR